MHTRLNSFGGASSKESYFLVTYEYVTFSNLGINFGKLHTIIRILFLPRYPGDYVERRAPIRDLHFQHVSEMVACWQRSFAIKS